MRGFRLLARAVTAAKIQTTIRLCRFFGYCGDYRNGYYCECRILRGRHKGVHYAEDRGYRVCW